MWQTLLINLKLHLREKTQLFWLFAFPIILATMFNGMFGNIAESFELHTLDVAVVEDNAWKTSYGAQTLIEGISSESSALSDNHVKVSADGENGTGLINTTKVESIAQAEQLLADGTAQGMLRIDDGRLRFSVSAVDAIVRVRCDGVEQRLGYFADGAGRHRGPVQPQHRCGGGHCEAQPRSSDEWQGDRQHRFGEWLYKGNPADEF